MSLLSSVHWCCVIGLESLERPTTLQSQSSGGPLDSHWYSQMTGIGWLSLLSIKTSLQNYFIFILSSYFSFNLRLSGWIEYGGLVREFIAWACQMNGMSYYYCLLHHIHSSRRRWLASCWLYHCFIICLQITFLDFWDCLFVSVEFIFSRWIN